MRLPRQGHRAIRAAAGAARAGRAHDRADPASASFRIFEQDGHEVQLAASDAVVVAEARAAERMSASRPISPAASAASGRYCALALYSHAGTTSLPCRKRMLMSNPLMLRSVSAKNRTKTRRLLAALATGSKPSLGPRGTLCWIAAICCSIRPPTPV
jgi:hypothetical protein